MNSPRAVDNRAVELRQQLGRHRQIRIENHQDVAARFGEAEPHRVAFAFAALLKDPQPPLRVQRRDALDFLPGAVVRVPLDEDQLVVRPHRRARDRSSGSMLPRSLRAGTTTETDGALAAGVGLTRATATLASVSSLNPGSGASQRLTSPLSSGTYTGSRTRCDSATSSNPDSASRFLMSDGASQFVIGAGLGETERPGQREDRLPQAAVVGDHDPRRGRAHGAHLLEDLLDVRDDVQAAVEDDAIERRDVCRRRHRDGAIAEGAAEIGRRRADFGDARARRQVERNVMGDEIVEVSLVDADLSRPVGGSDQWRDGSTEQSTGPSGCGIIEPQWRHWTCNRTPRSSSPVIAAWSARRSCAPPRRGFDNILTATRDQLDLRDQAAVNYWFRANRPEYVFLVAGTVGGILANSTRPAEFIYDNMMIHATVVHAAHLYRRRRSCCISAAPASTRATAPQPMTEDDAADRPARADQRGVRDRQDRRHQAVPGLPQAVRLRLHLGDADESVRAERQLRPDQLARAAGDDSQVPRCEGSQAAARSTIWGTGTPRREFLHVDDLADACVFLMEHYDEAMHINVGTGEDLSHPRAGRTWSRAIVYPAARARLRHVEAGRHAAQAARRLAAARARLASSHRAAAKASQPPTSGSSNIRRKCGSDRRRRRPRRRAPRPAPAAGSASRWRRETSAGSPTKPNS